MAPMIGGTSPLAIAFNQPVVAQGIRAVSRYTLHAVELSGCHFADESSRRTTVDALCGAQVRIVGLDMPTSDGGEIWTVMPWPPKLAPLRLSGHVRCPTCFDLSSKKRPRCTLEWKARDAEPT